MSKRFGLLGMACGMACLVLVGLLVACGTSYNSSTNGLLLVGSRGSALIETFSFVLNNGHVSAISNSPAGTSGKTCVLNGLPSSLVVEPSGANAYAILEANSSCTDSATGIQAFKVNSDGSIAPTGTAVTLNSGSVTIEGTTTQESVPVVPGSLTMDAAGKFLFVANRATTDSSNFNVPGSVSVFAISNGSLTEVPGSPFFASASAMTLSQAGMDIISVAASPTVFPKIGVDGVQNAVCSAPGITPPTSEYLYAVDAIGNQLFEFQVDTSSGVLSLATSTNQPFPTGAVPAGVAVDPCDRFVYVSDSLSNKISAYTICTVVQLPLPCPHADGSLVPVSGSPFSLSGSANGPGPLVVDPFGNNVYVIGTLSNTVSAFKISPVSGAITALSPPTVATGSGPTSIAIRSDDNWMFVTNYNSASVSQYSITPATGTLSVSPTIQTDNYPWGVAVK